MKKIVLMLMVLMAAGYAEDNSRNETQIRISDLARFSEATIADTRILSLKPNSARYAGDGWFEISRTGKFYRTDFFGEDATTEEAAIWRGKAVDLKTDIELLAKEGAICKAFGHWWEEEKEEWFENDTGIMRDYYLDGGFVCSSTIILTRKCRKIRECKLCGKRQWLTSEKWEDE